MSLCAFSLGWVQHLESINHFTQGWLGEEEILILPSSLTTLREKGNSTWKVEYFTQWKNPLLSIFHFRYWPKTLKKEVLKRNHQIILGFFDPDPVLLDKQVGGAKD